MSNMNQGLKNIRMSNMKNVIIGHLNVNSIAEKFDSLKLIILVNLNIRVICESKLDNSYPNSQFSLVGFSEPFRLDRNCHGGGSLIYGREDIPCKQLFKHSFPDDIEGIFVEVNLRKSKWLLFGTYHPPSQSNDYYFKCLSRALDIYNTLYDKLCLVGDFNTEENESVISTFLDLYHLKNLVKDKTCFKSLNRPTCFDLILTNCHRSFKHTVATSAGMSDHHKMIVTVLKTSFKKSKPRIITYRRYKTFDRNDFRDDL